uniref:Uncharacterized protein n=1 Tax=Micrurus lemniscatus lemniscatus TaxID=129467 RepID=A0A2D4ILV6_MICLE
MSLPRILVRGGQLAREYRGQLWLESLIGPRKETSPFLGICRIMTGNHPKSGPAGSCLQSRQRTSSFQGQLLRLGLGLELIRELGGISPIFLQISNFPPEQRGNFQATEIPQRSLLPSEDPPGGWVFFD